MEHIINQAPENISHDKIIEIYIKNSSNVIDTLVELWDIKEEKKEVTKEQQKWNEIRETCDSFDLEMYKQIKGDSNKPIENKPLNNIPIASCEVPEASCDVPEASCDVPEASCECTCTYDNDIDEQSIN